ncbi:MAG: hypothetical protein SOI66_09120 [Bifidobacterium sp.]|jgi:hypothetical protein
MSAGNVLNAALGGITFHADTTRGWLLQGITGWTSLAESKAEVRERPQAHGAFDPGTDWRKSLAISLKVAWLGDDQQELEQAIDSLNDLGALDHPVPLSVTTTAGTRSRTVSIRSIDPPDGHGRSNLGDIPIDMIAMDPRVYSPAASDITGPPRHGGGLLFDSPLRTGWTGDVDRSPSTLARDGNVIATNLFKNPSFDPEGQMPVLTSGAGVNMHDGVATLTTTNNKDLNGAVFGISMQPGIYYIAFRVANWTSQTPSPSNAPRVFVVRDLNDMTLYSTNVLQYPSDGVMYQTVNVRDTASSNIGIGFLGPDVNGGTVDVSQVLVCTSADWQAMQEAGIAWFDGDSYRGHLLFPVGFGEPGDDGRARFANTGTAPTSVSLTLTGGGSQGVTLKRVENGATLTLARPCNANDRIVFDSSDGSVLLNDQAELSGWMTSDDFDGFDVGAAQTCTVQLGILGEPVGDPRLVLTGAPARW